MASTKLLTGLCEQYVQARDILKVMLHLQCSVTCTSNIAILGWAEIKAVALEPQQHHWLQWVMAVAAAKETLLLVISASVKQSAGALRQLLWD